MDPKRIEELKAAMQQMKDLGVPDHLQETALKHLLGSAPQNPEANSASSASGAALSLEGETLRSFVEPLQLKGAVMEIPALLYWAQKNGDREDADERGIVELYRRAGLRPPKNIYQSLKDLSSKKYLRLESVEGKPKHYRLSRTGEDFVIHEIVNGN